MFCGFKKTFDRVLGKVLEWAMMKKGIPEVLVISVMNLYDGAKTRIRVDSELSDELELRGGTKDLCCHHFIVQWC